MSGMPASVMARVGPQLRSPTGGYFATATNASASSTVLIIGAITPSAPMSSTRLATAKPPTGMRTIGAAPACRITAMPVTVPAVSHSPDFLPRAAGIGIGFGFDAPPLELVDELGRERGRLVRVEAIPKS